MSFSLLLPAALASFAALLLPLLLHLARRSEDKRVVFAALRWLREKPKPRRRLRFDEWLLLALRLLLLAVLALWLARPVLQGAGADKAWIVAMPGIDAAQVHELAGTNKSELHWLAPGFPEISATN
ncbi:MAG: BatA domain-containing protein, partial [Pseudoxanthomonas sp.]